MHVQVCVQVAVVCVYMMTLAEKHFWVATMGAQGIRAGYCYEWNKEQEIETKQKWKQ